MQEIIELASRLGALMAGHERYRRLRAAESAVQADAEARGLLARLESRRRKIADLEAQVKPVEPEDKRELQRLTDAVHSDVKLQNLARVQADYMEMMNKVNSAIRGKLDTGQDAGSGREQSA